jgi:hypothetical protein
MGSRLVGNSESVTDSVVPIAADHTAIREQDPVFRHHFLGIHSKEDLHKVDEGENDAGDEEEIEDRAHGYSVFMERVDSLFE